MGNFAENLNSGKHNQPHSYKDELKIILLDEIEGAVESTWFDNDVKSMMMWSGRCKNSKRVEYLILAPSRH